MPSDTMRILFSKEEIKEKIIALAHEINQSFPKPNEKGDGQRPLVLCVLRGAVFFFADLVRELDSDFNFEIDFIKLTSYGNTMQSAGDVRITTDTTVDLTDRDVLVVEDIVDSGHSMQFLRKEFAKRNVRSMRIACLIDKDERRETDVMIDYKGFYLTEGFIVGYGLDYAEKYRCLPDIYEII